LWFVVIDDKYWFAWHGELSETAGGNGRL